MKKPVQSELLPRKRLLAASVALAALCTAASGAHAATIGPNFCLAGSNASLCNMQIDLRSGGDDEEDDHPSAITYQSAGYVGVSMAISSTGAGANALQNLSFTLTGRQTEGRQWGFTDLWINLVPGALAGILPNLKSISQSTVAKDGSTTNGTVSFTNGFSFQKKDSSATGSNYYGVLKNADNKDVGPWGTFNFGLQAKGEDNPLVQAQITLSWDLDGPILNDLLTQPVMALNGTNAGAPGAGQIQDAFDHIGAGHVCCRKRRAQAQLTAGLHGDVGREQT